jgi:hypothetical protein
MSRFVASLGFASPRWASIENMRAAITTLAADSANRGPLRPTYSAVRKANIPEFVYGSAAWRTKVLAFVHADTAG